MLMHMIFHSIHFTNTASGIILNKFCVVVQITIIISNCLLTYMNHSKDVIGGLGKENTNQVYCSRLNLRSLYLNGIC